MGLYLENGYANIAEVLRRGITFNIMIGGRGTGKTFGALQYVRNNNIGFALMRRTQSQLDTIAKSETSPFKAVDLMENDGWTVEPQPLGKNIYGYYHTTIGEDNNPVYGDLMGYGLALSTVANMRGFDMSNLVDLIIYDEFIPEKHERSIKAESNAFYNAYETINRNRELQGRKPCQVLLLANANDFACPLLVGMKLVGTIERMIKTGKTEYINPQKGVAIYLLTDSPISTRKSRTALYKLTHGTSYSEMAISNAFEGTNDPDVVPQPLNDYAPMVGVGELTVYKHKSDRLYYISVHRSGTIPEYSGDGVDMKRFFHSYKVLLLAIMSNRVLYESHLAKALFLRYCGYN